MIGTIAVVGSSLAGLAYSKIVGGTNELLQMYSRGGNHIYSDPCIGSAYKARLYGDGTATWIKEVTFPAYTDERGKVETGVKLSNGQWIEFKAIIYNYVENGNTYVRMESYVDDRQKRWAVGAATSSISSNIQ